MTDKKAPNLPNEGENPEEEFLEKLPSPVGYKENEGAYLAAREHGKQLRHQINRSQHNSSAQPPAERVPATPSEEREMSKLLRDEILVLLEEHARTGSPYFKGDKEIAERLGRSVREVQQQLDILESQGLITAANSHQGNNARISPQGSLKVEQLEESAGLHHQALPAGKPDPRRVFVVHGRNQAARSAVSDFLAPVVKGKITPNRGIKRMADAAR